MKHVSLVPSHYILLVLHFFTSNSFTDGAKNIENEMKEGDMVSLINVNPQVNDTLVAVPPFGVEIGKREN